MSVWTGYESQDCLYNLENQNQVSSKDFKAFPAAQTAAFILSDKKAENK